jgi:IS1 family transposase
LCEGNSIASTVRIVGVAENTVLDLMLAAGEACAAYMDKHMVDLPCTELQLDEIWSFVGCKEKVKKHAKLQHPGDVWTWKGICADTKLIVGWHMGERSNEAAQAFCADLARRINHRVQITSDGLPSYQWAVGCAFRKTGVDYARLVKLYGTDSEGREVCTGTRKEAVIGNPDMDKVSTSYIERANLTLRMHNRRFTRKTNGHSKKLRNHGAMLALGIMAYNFCRPHMTLKKTPAQAAGLSDHVWSMEEIVRMMDSRQQEQEEAAFEAAFTQAHWTPKRRSYVSEPTPLDKDGSDPTEKGLTD